MASVFPTPHNSPPGAGFAPLPGSLPRLRPSASNACTREWSVSSCDSMGKDCSGATKRNWLDPPSSPVHQTPSSQPGSPSLGRSNKAEPLVPPERRRENEPKPSPLTYLRTVEPFARQHILRTESFRDAFQSPWSGTNRWQRIDGRSPPQAETAATITQQDSRGVGDRTSCVRLVCLTVAWIICCYAWVMGALLRPMLHVDVLEGTRFARSLQRYLLGTLVDLYHQHMWVSLCILGFFSIVVPVVKLACTLWLIWQMSRSSLQDVARAHGRIIWTLTRLSSYQLIDLYVGVLFVIFFNTDSIEASLLEGFYWFFGYCMVSLVCSEVVAGAFAQVEGSASWAAPREAQLEPIDDMSLFCGSCPTPNRASLLPGSSPKAAPGGTSVRQPKQHRVPAAPCPRVEVLEAKSILFFSAAVASLLGACICSGEDILEVRSLWSGVIVDHSAHTLPDILFNRMTSVLRPEVSVALVVLNLIVPGLYLMVLLVAVIASRGFDIPGDGIIMKSCRLLADLLRPWATLDVFVLASLIFLFTMQDQHTLTIPPEGSVTFYLFLGAGLSFFFLRWFAASPIARSKFTLLLVTWGVLCCLILKGVPGSHPNLTFPTLDSICTQTLPIVDRAVRHGVPATLGDCNNVNAKPPQPCKGDKLLLNTTTDDGFVQAIWMGGLDTMALDGCKLWQESGTNGPSLHVNKAFHLTIEGIFKHLSLFLHLKQCGPFGCTTMNSADHCCGDDIRFRLTFGMHCRSGSPAEALRDISIESAEIDPMLIRKRLLDKSWYNVAVDAVDISPQVEKVVQDMISKFIPAAKIFWAGRQMHLTEWLNLMLSYNSPNMAGSC